mmetsp:Transcript_14366/g.42903  ORF Transcript_14366/g.42903 Transcript_14366/m.42903 type:complete len:273 (+) Transcript_14366:196-1014(+)
MSMRLAMKASMETAQSDGKAQKAAARKAKKEAKAARQAELARAALPPPLDHTAGVDAETGAMRSRVAAKLEDILATVDLEAVSTKSLRKRIEEEESVDLSGDHKAWFKGLVADLLARKTAVADAGKKPELADDEEDPRHPRLSPEMAVVAGVSRANHFRLIKLLWKYIKAHDLQNPANKNEILCDEALRAVFRKDKVSGFGMSKLIGAHIIKDEDVAQPRPKKKKRREPVEEDEEDEEEEDEEDDDDDDDEEDEDDEDDDEEDEDDEDDDDY